MEKIFTCPMHHEIRQNKPGSCPVCKMDLVLETEVVSSHRLREYMPLIVIISVILLTTLALSYKDFLTGHFTPNRTITYFMSGFFLTFASFKLMDLKGFAEGYAMYDLLAKRWYPYGYIYPFIELFLGLAMILWSEVRILLFAEMILMLFSGVGVMLKLLKKEKFQCACLGTMLKVPLTKITLVEDFGMATFALLMLILH